MAQEGLRRHAQTHAQRNRRARRAAQQPIDEHAPVKAENRVRQTSHRRARRHAQVGPDFRLCALPLIHRQPQAVQPHAVRRKPEREGFAQREGHIHPRKRGHVVKHGELPRIAALERRRKAAHALQLKLRRAIPDSADHAAERLNLRRRVVKQRHAARRARRAVHLMTDEVFAAPVLLIRLIRALLRVRFAFLPPILRFALQVLPVGEPGEAGRFDDELAVQAGNRHRKRSAADEGHTVRVFQPHAAGDGQRVRVPVHRLVNDGLFADELRVNRAGEARRFHADGDRRARRNQLRIRVAEGHGRARGEARPLLGFAKRAVRAQRLVTQHERTALPGRKIIHQHVDLLSGVVFRGIKQGFGLAEDVAAVVTHPPQERMAVVGGQPDAFRHAAAQTKPPHLPRAALVALNGHIDRHAALAVRLKILDPEDRQAVAVRRRVRAVCRIARADDRNVRAGKRIALVIAHDKAELPAGKRLHGKAHAAFRLREPLRLRHKLRLRRGIRIIRRVKAFGLALQPGGISGADHSGADFLDSPFAFAHPHGDALPFRLRRAVPPLQIGIDSPPCVLHLAAIGRDFVVKPLCLRHKGRVAIGGSARRPLELRAVLHPADKAAHAVFKQPRQVLLHLQGIHTLTDRTARRPARALPVHRGQRKAGLDLLRRQHSVEGVRARRKSRANQRQRQDQAQNPFHPHASIRPAAKAEPFCNASYALLAFHYMPGRIKKEVNFCSQISFFLPSHAHFGGIFRLLSF